MSNDKIGVLITAIPVIGGPANTWEGSIQFPDSGMIFPFRASFITALKEIGDFLKFTDPIFTENRVWLEIRNENGGSTWLSPRNHRFWKFHVALTCHTLEGIAGSIASAVASPMWWEDDLPEQEFSIPKGIHYDMDPDKAIEDLLSSAMSAS